MPAAGPVSAPSPPPGGASGATKTAYALTIGSLPGGTPFPGRRHWSDDSEQAERLRLGAPADTRRDPARHQQPHKLV
jgi:hypothetical protein